MRNNPSDTGSSDDFTTDHFVLAEEVDRQLCPVYDTFEIYISTQQVWFRWDSLIVSQDSSQLTEALLVGSAMLENED